jgi:hypothetical protein
MQTKKKVRHKRKTTKKEKKRKTKNRKRVAQDGEANTTAFKVTGCPAAGVGRLYGHALGGTG